MVVDINDAEKTVKEIIDLVQQDDAIVSVDEQNSHVSIKNMHLHFSIVNAIERCYWNFVQPVVILMLVIVDVKKEDLIIDAQNFKGIMGPHMYHVSKRVVIC